MAFSPERAIAQPITILSFARATPVEMAEQTTVSATAIKKTIGNLLNELL
jgi:hypothetical protein